MSNDLGARYDRLVFERRLLVWVHLLLGFAAALSYLSTLDLHFRFWRSGGGAVLMGRLLPPMLPYLVSATYTRTLVAVDRLGLWLFMGTLVVTTGAVCYWYAGPVKPFGLVGVVVAVFLQFFVLSWAAATCLRGARGAPS
jgi:hypothetical protein